MLGGGPRGLHGRAWVAASVGWSGGGGANRRRWPVAAPRQAWPLGGGGAEKMRRESRGRDERVRERRDRDSDLGIKVYPGVGAAGSGIEGAGHGVEPARGLGRGKECAGAWAESLNENNRMKIPDWKR